MPTRLPARPLQSCSGPNLVSNNNHNSSCEALQPA
jgi:hypothetical protein